MRMVHEAATLQHETRFIPPIQLSHGQVHITPYLLPFPSIPSSFHTSTYTQSDRVTQDHLLYTLFIGTRGLTRGHRAIPHDEGKKIHQETFSLGMSIYKSHTHVIASRHRRSGREDNYLPRGRACRSLANNTGLALCSRRSSSLDIRP
jgi:hypothetical protein